MSVSLTIVSDVGLDPGTGIGRSDGGGEPQWYGGGCHGLGKLVSMINDARTRWRLMNLNILILKIIAASHVLTLLPSSVRYRLTDN